MSETRPLLTLSSGNLPTNRQSVNEPFFAHGSRARAAHLVPRRAHALHTNVVFAVASVFLNVAFVLLNFFPTHVVPVNATFLVGALFLTHAFCMLTHWSVQIAPAQRSWLLLLDLVSTLLKVPSAVLLTLQPLTALWNADMGVPWSNFAGIAALAVLNTVNGVTMPIMLWQRGKFVANLPSLAAWVFAFATYALTIANAVVLFQPTALSPAAMMALQFSGAVGYFLGACMFWMWAYRGDPLAM